MNEPLNDADFTEYVVTQLARYEQLQVSSSAPLVVSVYYGLNEPVLTLRLEQAYEEYKRETQSLTVIVQPLITEVGWTVHGKRYSFGDMSEHTLPLMRDLNRLPFHKDVYAEQSASSQTELTELSFEDEPDESPQLMETPPPSRGPLVYTELVRRPEEDVIVQLVLAKNELVQPLYVGDVLRSCPEPARLMPLAVQNLRRKVLSIGLSLSEYPIANFPVTPWLVGFRQGRFRQFLASLITVPEVMATLQSTLQAENGLLAILPARDQLLVCPSSDDETNTHMGMLATHLKNSTNEPVSCFIWHFNDGVLRRVQTIDVRDIENES